MEKNKIICLIDDEEIVQFIVKTIVKKLNINVNLSSYFSGTEALNSFKQLLGSVDELPDIILLDINMPVMNGWQFLEEFIKLQSQINKKIVIYIFSSSTSIEDMNKSKSYVEISGYLSKPISTDTLKNIIQLHLSS